MKSIKHTSRTSAYGQNYSFTWIDAFGVWLSWRKIRSFLPGTGTGVNLGDFGCGYNANLVRKVLPSIAHAVLIDLQLASDLKNHPKVLAIEGSLPTALEGLPAESLDVIVCNSVIEHLWQPQETIDHFLRILRPGGYCLINVPSWRGKWFLEFSAFRLGLSPITEMNDHKTYYDPKDLWPLLVRAGFLPFNIQCGRHKFGLNTFAACRKAQRTNA